MKANKPQECFSKERTTKNNTFKRKYLIISIIQTTFWRKLRLTYLKGASRRLPVVIRASFIRLGW